MAGELATAAVEILAELDRFEPDLRRKLTAAVQSAADDAEKQMRRGGTRSGKAFSDAVNKAAGSTATYDRLKASLAGLEGAAQKAGDAQADAAGKVRIAEAKLQEVRDKGDARASQLAAAEENLAQAQRRSAAATKLATAATDALKNARAKVSAQAREQGTEAGDQFGEALRVAARKASDDAGDESGTFFTRAFERAAARAVGSGLFRSFAVGAAGLVTALSPASTLLGGVTAAILALVGAIGQASGSVLSLGALLGSLGLAALTVKLGFGGVGDALKASAEAAAEFAATGSVSEATTKKLDAALQALQPSAREVVSALRGIALEFATVRNAVQQNLFSELGPQLVQLGRTFLPLVSSSLVDFAQILNVAALDFLKFIRSGENTQRISTILQGLEPILRTLLTAIKPLTDAFLRVFEKSLPFAQQLSTIIAGLAQRFAAFITTTTKSGAFSDFMTTAFQLAGELFGIFGKLGSILGSVFAAGAESGGGLLQLLNKLLGGVADFLKSTNGQTALASFFGLISQAGSILLNTFKTLTPIFQGLSTVFTALQGPIAQLGIALQPVIGQLALTLGDALKTLAPIVAQLVTALTPLVAGLLGGLVTAFSELFVAITPIFPVLVQVVQALVTGLLPVLPQLVAILSNSINGFAQLVVALLPLVPSLLQLIPPLTQMVVAFAQLVVALLPLINLFTQFSVEAIGRMLPAIIFLINATVQFDTFIAKLATTIASVVRVIVDFVVQAVANFQSLRDQGGGLISSLIGAIIGAFNSLPPNVLAAIRGMISGALSAIGGFISSAGTAAGKVAAAIVSAIKTGLSGIAGFFRAPFDAAKSGVSSALQSILGVVEGFVSKISGAISKISGAISNIPHPSLGGLDLPFFANGGLATKPSIAGEAGPEVVIPLSKPRRRDDLLEKYFGGWADQRAWSGGGGYGGKQTTLHMPINAGPVSAEELARMVVDQVELRFGRHIGIETTRGPM